MGDKNLETKVHGLEEPTSELEIYAQEVMNEMVRQNVPPTPSNFEAYFDKLLESKSSEFRKRILTLLELEDGEDLENQTIMEQHLKEAFVNIKKFMQVINLIYKNLRHLTVLIEKRRQELEAVADKTGMIALIKTIDKDIKLVNETVKKESIVLKDTFQSTSELVHDVQELAIFDNRYGVYKRKYFLKKIEQEIKLIKEFNHETSIMMIRPENRLLKKFEGKKTKFVILRTVARLLLKTSRRSDIVAIYDEEIFALMMKHTSIQNAKRAAERVKELINNSNFFVGDEEVCLDVNIGIAKIDPERSVDATVICAIDAIKESIKNNLVAGVCKQDESVNIAND